MPSISAKTQSLFPAVLSNPCDRTGKEVSKAVQRCNTLAAGTHRFRCAVLSLALAALALTAGCGRQTQTQMMRLDPKAPAASGLLLAPEPGQPSPLLQRPPFGLYAHYPSDDTLKALSTGTLSPDGQFRFAMTAQGLWVARADAAWLWQVELPAPPAAPPDPKATTDPKAATPPADPTKPAAVAPEAQKPRTLVGFPQWTNRGRLLLQDSANTWYEADPVTGTVRPLPAVFNGARGLTPSPDGTQVFYYLDGKTGRQLWTAKADGTNPKLVGENLIAQWDPVKGTLLTQASAPTPDPKQNSGNQTPFSLGSQSQ